MTSPAEPVRVIAPITLDHIALQAEILVNELRNLPNRQEMEQADIDQLHRLVACCLLFLDSGVKRG